MTATNIAACAIAQRVAATTDLDDFAGVYTLERLSVERVSKHSHSSDFGPVNLASAQSIVDDHSTLRVSGQDELGIRA